MDVSLCRPHCTEASLLGSRSLADRVLVSVGDLRTSCLSFIRPVLM